MKAPKIGAELTSLMAERVGGCPNEPMVPVTTAVDTAIPTTFQEFMTKYVNDAITP